MQKQLLTMPCNICQWHGWKLGRITAAGSSWQTGQAAMQPAVLLLTPALVTVSSVGGEKSGGKQTLTFGDLFRSHQMRVEWRKKKYIFLLGSLFLTKDLSSVCYTETFQADLVQTQNNLFFCSAESSIENTILNGLNKSLL